MQMDRYDRKILELLQAQGRLSNQELAEQIGLSPSPCLRRLRHLEDAGVITGYHASLDPRMLGLTLTALIHISMDQHTEERFSEFERQIKAIPQIIECLLITGQAADYQLKAVVPDMDAYRELLLEHIPRIPGVSGVHTSFVLKQIGPSRQYPIMLP